MKPGREAGSTALNSDQTSLEHICAARVVCALSCGAGAAGKARFRAAAAIADIEAAERCISQ